MSEITHERLTAYLDDALSEEESAVIEKELRSSAELRVLLTRVREERDRGEHSLGAIWRRERLSCASREELSGYLLETLDAARQGYIRFHLQVIECPFCTANLADLEARQAEQVAIPVRRQRVFDSSVGLLTAADPTKR